MLSGWDARCYVYDDIIREFDAIDVARGEDRRYYRQETVEEHLANLPFEDGCA